MKTDEEIKKEYYESQGLNTNDASREFYLKAIKARAKVKGYKVTGFTKMPVSQLREIYNKSNNLSK
jgi:hypothetical protein